MFRTAVSGSAKRLRSRFALDGTMAKPASTLRVNTAYLPRRSPGSAIASHGVHDRCYHSPRVSSVDFRPPGSYPKNLYGRPRGGFSMPKTKIIMPIPELRAVSSGDDPDPWDALAIACRLAAAGEPPHVEQLLIAVGTAKRAA